MKKLVTALSAVVAMLVPLVVFAPPAMALTSGTLGADISWPQCTSTGISTPPSGTAAFGIVGVNDGKPATLNPCLGQEYTWAEAPTGTTAAQAPQLYVNTADPGNTAADWPSSDTYSKEAGITNPYGACAPPLHGRQVGPDNQACAFEYGVEQARNDLTYASNAGASTTTWWLDVETANTWLYHRQISLNQADLLGMVYTFQASGSSTTVGAYSTSYQWNKILGTVGTTASVLETLPEWIPGASAASPANSCTGPNALPSFDYGSITYVQYTTTFDYDFACS